MTIGVVRRMGIVAGDDPVVAKLVAVDALAGGAGGPRLGVLAALADSVAGVHALVERPDAVPLTVDLAVHGSPLVVAPGTVIVASSTRLKRRRAGAVFEVDLREEGRDGRSLGFGTVTYAFTEGTYGPYAPEPLEGTWPPADLASSLDEVMATRTGANGGLEIDIDDTTCNALGVLSGGAAVLLADLSAERAGQAALGAPVVVSDLVVHFLAAGRAGPAEAVVEPLAIHGASASVRLSLADVGEGGRLLAVATATVQHAPAQPSSAGPATATAGEGSR